MWGFFFWSRNDFVEVALNVCFSSPTASYSYSHDDSECYRHFHGDKANVLRRCLGFFFPYQSFYGCTRVGTILIGFRAGHDTISNGTPATLHPPVRIVRDENWWQKEERIHEISCPVATTAALNELFSLALYFLKLPQTRLSLTAQLRLKPR